MDFEKQLIEKFQVEELEKRYEFSWSATVEVTPTVITEPNHEDPLGGPNEVYYGGSVKVKF